MTVPPFGIGVIGCGNISHQYLRHLTAFPDLAVVICADLEAARAKAQAAAYGVPAWGSPADALAHPGVQLIVNLTIPAAHAGVSAAAIAAGKHVWSEKPLTLDVAGGRGLLAAADAAGVRVGCAPDTVLGAGLQSARRLIDSGAIGTPLSALALLQGPGPQSWHPDPEFLFAPGAGPLFDLGPYYLSVLAVLFGPALRVAAVGRRPSESRVIGSGPRAGTEFAVAVPTYVAALAEYAAGQAASLLFSWDSPLRRAGFVEITGTEATLALPDPNGFGGDLRVRGAGDDDWTVIPAAGATAGRGTGVVDMVRAIRAGAPHRASGELALHVLEMMTAIERSAVSGAFEPVESHFDTPAPLDPQWDPYVTAN
jgi:predicted dehydrogenase